MIQRDDLHGPLAPMDHQQFLLKYGGKNPFGEPLWRLVLASSVWWKIAGDFKIWDKSIPVNERGGIDMWNGGREFDHKPIRVQSGMMERRKYPHIEGWILQLWFPASKYDRKTWFAPQNCMFDGTPKLGPFPECGDYELMNGPYQHLPSLSQIREWIGEYWRDQEATGGYWRDTAEQLAALDARMRDACEQAEQEEEQYENRLFSAVDAFMRDKCSYIWSNSLEAGRIRTEVAKKCGIKEHVGA